MEMVLLMGIQATGKSSFCRERLFRTHVRVNLDMLRTRHRENLLVEACLKGGVNFVVDNTNLTRSERARYIQPAKAAGFRIVGYFFESRITDAIRRNAARPESERILPKAIPGASNRLELPAFEEGFDELFFVRLAANNQITVESWKS
jgi:predicted kinase